MSKNFEHIIHKKSNQVINGSPKLPTSSQIEYGEIAINYAKDNEKISLKNSNNEIVTFSPDSNFVTIKDFDDTEHAIAAALNDLDERISESGDNVESQINDLSSDINDVKQLITDNEIVTSAALNDLNTRLIYVSEDVEDKQDTLVSGTNIKTINNQSLLGSGNITIQGSGSGDTNVIETVKVNGTALTPDSNKAVDITSIPASIVTQDATHRFVSDTEKSAWNSKTDNIGTITGITMNGASKGTSGVVDLGTVITSHQDISGKADKSAAIGSLSLSLNSTNYQITLSGTKVDGTTFTVSDIIDLPLESVVVNGSYNDTTKKVVLTLQNGSTIDFSVADLVAGLQTEITSTNKLSADLISDGTTNKTVTATEKSTWSGKQDALTFDGTYNASSNKAATVSTVTNAINALDGGTIGTGGAGKTITSLSQTNGNVSATFADISITKSQVSDFPTTMTPTAHNQASNTINAMTGYSKGSSSAAVAATDTLNAAISKLENQIDTKTSNTGTITGINMNGSSKGTSGVVDLGTVITSETALSKGTTTGSGNAVTDISVSGHQITLTKGTTFLTSHQDIKTLNGTALTGTGNITLTGVPAFTSADNGKILGVVNGQLAWVTPTTIYTGSGTPSSSQGNDGDIYLQTS